MGKQLSKSNVETPEEREVFKTIEVNQSKSDGVTGHPAPAAPACPKCAELNAEIQRFRGIIRRAIHAPQDSDAVAEIFLAE